MLIGFIGNGNMGSALAGAVLSVCYDDDKKSIYISDFDRSKVNAFCEKTGATASDNAEISAKCDIIFLGVKPQVLPSLALEISSIINSRKTLPVLISMAAGITLESLEQMFGSNCPIVRIMPNLPASVGKGVILYCTNGHTSTLHENCFKDLMSDAGSVYCLDEKLFDAASALTGCGPAFVCLFIEALADGAVSCGVPRDKATDYAIETVIGTAELLKETKKHPAVLKDEVCSPAGSTIEGVKTLENGSFRASVISAVNASYKRTKDLGRK